MSAGGDQEREPTSMQGESSPRPALAQAFRSSAVVAVLTFGALSIVPYLAPRLERLRIYQPLRSGQSMFSTNAPPAPAASVGEVSLSIATEDSGEQAPSVALTPLAAAGANVPAVVASGLSPEAGRPGATGRRFVDPSGSALDAFYAKLGQVESKVPGSMARISYYGDSIVAGDFVTGTMRRKLQRRFGDGGHGFILLASPWPGYNHNDVVRFATPGWQVNRVVGPFAKDGLYGLGGVSFRTEGPGAFARFSTAKKGEVGRSVSRLTVDYLAHPGGGAMRIRIDGEDRERLDTKADLVESRLRTFEVPDGPHELEVRAETGGVRAFGVVLERQEPGVVLDSLGIQGCRMRFLDQTDDAHFAEQLRLRDPSLVVFHYGMNESEDGELYPLDQVEATSKRLLEQVRTALPRASCLLVGPMDRADRRGDAFTSRPVIPKLGAVQRKVAAEMGCAYFDTFAAMGGTGSMGVWVQRGLGAADLAHPTGAGAEVIAGWLEDALLSGYAEWAARRR